MPRKRFQSKRRKKNGDLEVDITSLLDILVILLVFLLKSYNPTDLKLDVVKNVELPNSESKALGHTATTIQVSSERNFWIDNKKIGELNPNEKTKYENLFAKLTEIKDKMTEEEKQRSPASDLEKINKKISKINLVFDQSLPYEVIQTVMHTAATAGFTQYKFIVQGKYQ